MTYKAANFRQTAFAAIVAFALTAGFITGTAHSTFADLAPHSAQLA
jgi:hypothetical protein